MTKTLLTTIGTNDYSETIYHFADQKADPTRYVAQALCQLFDIEKVIVLVTPEARQKHWSTLQSSLTIESIAKDIPSGETEAETWQIFDVLVESIEPNTQILFDITHAFRSIPILILLGSAFLRKAKNVDIQGLYYGLYRKEQPQTPIIDLTPALRLLDWLTATDKFITTGSSLELGELLNTIQRDFYGHQKSLSGDSKPTHLQNFGATIKEISRSIELIRPISLLEKDLPALQKRSTQDLADEVGKFAKPFSLLLQSIQDSYNTLAISSEVANDERTQIQKHFQLLHWYVDKQFSAQAILLAREWVISALCISEGIQKYREPVYRKAIEYQLGSMIGRGDNPNLNQPIASHVADPKQLSDFWAKLIDYRNDIAHVQMRLSPFTSKTLEAFALSELIPTLEALFPSLTQLP
jgi:hypothetical protein